MTLRSKRPIKISCEGRKIVKILVKTFFFLEITWFLPEKSVEIPVKTLFFCFFFCFFLLEITSVFGSNSSIFSVYFGLHTTRIPSCWSWPRAQVRLSAFLAPGQHSSFWTIVTMVANRWQHCVWFDRPEIWISDLPLQKRTRYRSTNWLVETVYHIGFIVPLTPWILFVAYRFFFSARIVLNKSLLKYKNYQCFTGALVFYLRSEAQMVT